MDDHALLTAREIHGPYVQLLTNLQGQDGSMWLASLKRFLRKENPWDGNTFIPWKTITLGEIQTKQQFQDILYQPGKIAFDSRIIQLLDGISIRQDNVELDLILVTPHQLGFDWDQDLDYETICTRAYIRGLELCPDETPFLLRTAYLNQPKNKRLFVATEHIFEQGGQNFILELIIEDGVRWIEKAKLPEENKSFSDETLFVFSRAREKT